MAQEPALTIGGVASLIAAAIILARAFGVPINPDQEAALLGFVAVAAPIIAALVIRGFVFSPDSAQRAADEAYRAGQIGAPPPPKVIPPGT